MSDIDTNAGREDFERMLTALNLKAIQPLSMRFERTDALVVLPEGEYSLNWNQAFPTNDPQDVEASTLTFHPRYTVTVKHGEALLFLCETVIGIAFTANDRAAFDRAWNNEAARKIFYEKQIMKTLWPVVRQQVLDGMSRLGLPGIPLPWLLN
jgi:hypothetical protein